MTSWFQKLLVDEPTQAFKEQIFDLARAEARKFLDAYPKNVPDNQVSMLDAWYHSAVGQATLVAAFDKAWAQLAGVAPYAMPAHDARHAIFKVPASALEYVAAERVGGFERIGVLGALLHDHGRWPEERLLGGAGASALHARLSFLLSRELLSEFEMPEAIWTQICHATLQHTKGAAPLDSMPTKLTVVADREQLYGAEVVTRLMHIHDPANECSLIYGTSPTDKASVLQRIAFFFQNRFPGPLFQLQQQSMALRDDSLMFLLMAEDEARSRARFAAPFEYQGAMFDHASHWARATAQLPASDGDVVAAMRSLLSAANVAPGEHFVAGAVAKLADVPDGLRERLAGALHWAVAARTAEDERQTRKLAQLARHWRAEGDVFLAHVTEQLLAKWNG